MYPERQTVVDLSKRGGATVATTNKVLRNTYWLLALSMLPTVLGAVIGVAYHVPVMRGGMGALLFLAIAFGFIWGIERNKQSGVGVALLLGFTFFMGLMLTPLLTYTLGFSNGALLIMNAFGGTAAVFAVMATWATVSKRDFSVLGKWLFAAVIVLILAGFANIFLQMAAMQIALSVLAIGVFSAFILFDVQRVVNGGETNYISATLAIYLDVYNIFTNLLALLGLAGGSRD
ncbi:Bax inhibitor-1/YccA family protein [Massilia arenosa]|uniref:Bax inhibitor-1/YccA family protein n=1 Tax=Zemynaea arenosa TaxID=2561931 RepID=A0A4Y9SQY8_9BURK|nr:Bax inhibitor-1/YccA family protein [Massilia arenosa]TFW27897.1 Bax inhibitor-1/YccA family protein [Massilia arenosa]